MPRTVLFLIALFLIAIPALHMTPVGDLDLGGTEIGPFRLSQLFHVAMFLPWGILGLCFVYRLPSGRFVRGGVWVLLGLFVGGGAEGAQYWISYRAFSLVDMMFNLSGVLLGSAVLLLLRPKNELQRRRSAEKKRFDSRQSGPGEKLRRSWIGNLPR